MFSLISANWEWFLLGLYVLEKAILLSPTKKDDMIFDMIIRPLTDKFKRKF